MDGLGLGLGLGLGALARTHVLTERGAQRTFRRSRLSSLTTTVQAGSRVLGGAYSAGDAVGDDASREAMTSPRMTRCSARLGVRCGVEGTVSEGRPGNEGRLCNSAEKHCGRGSSVDAWSASEGTLPKAVYDGLPAGIPTT
jgi:hypothetical protein